MVTLSSIRRTVEAQQQTDGLDSAQVLGLAGSGVSVYETLDSLPATGLTEGDEAFVKSNNRLYVSNGSGWYNITLVNRTPRFETTPNANYTIDDSATPLIITAKALDSDNPDAGLINQSFASDSAQYMVNITSDSSVFTFTPKSADSIGIEVANGNLSDSNGDFTYTFKWTDGINFTSTSSIIAYYPGSTPSQDASFTISGDPNISSTTRTAQTLVADVSSYNVVNPILPPDANSGGVTIGQLPTYSFVIPGTEPFTLRCYQAQGSGGNGATNGGRVYYFDVTVTPISKDSKIYIRPGQRGFKSYQSDADGTAGGSGGLGQVWIEDVNGGITASDGKNVRPIILVAGSGGGNDRTYQGFTTYGQTYTTITTSTSSTWNPTSNPYQSSGTTYTRGSGTAYGGYPNGTGGDDTATTTVSSANIVNTDYCSNYSMSGSYYNSYAQYYNAVPGKFTFIGKVVLS